SGSHRDLHSFPTRRSSDLPFLAASFISLTFTRLTSTLILLSSANFRILFLVIPSKIRSLIGAVNKVSLTLKNTFMVPASSKYSRSEEHTSELQSRENLVCR